MREIKFRIWNNDKKMWCPDDQELIYGDNIYDNIYLILKPDRDNVIIQQFTGLKDKNGKDIYEGDIIESIENGMRYLIHDIFPLTRHPGLCSSTPISKNTKEFGVIKSNGISEDYSDDWVSNPEFYEVIGNIFKNPELINHPLT